MADLQQPMRVLTRQSRFLLLDLSVLALAAASLFILVADVTVSGPRANVWLLRLDWAAVFVFAVLAAARAFTVLNPVRYVKHHWFDLFGLLPLTQPLFGLDAWWTLIGVVIVIARANTALDRWFGDRVLPLVFARYRSAFVEELTEPILVRLIVLLRDAVAKGHYTTSMGNVVDERRGDIHEAVRRALASSPKLSWLRALPGADRKIEEAVDEVTTAVVVALTSEELDSLVRDALTRALEDLRAEVAKPSWKEKGVTVGDIARGFAGGGGR